PQAIWEILVDATQRHLLDGLPPPLRRLAKETSTVELSQKAGTSLHEGVVIRAAPRHWLKSKELIACLRSGPSPSLFVALDRVRNPYNIGAIIRSAAFFGVEAVILGSLAPHTGLSPDAIRVAEGGAELVRFARTTDLAETLNRLRDKGACVCGAESEGGGGVETIPKNTPLVFVFGHEREGLSKRVRETCDLIVSIPRRTALASLNVAVAAGILIHEMRRPPLKNQGLRQKPASSQ
ncbi:MAG: RNA methyltransferase, partial [Deltaproteobacteria bacterium]|nr:RNA methyltransferase [Deltaproteobacteria bacterium]